MYRRTRVRAPRPSPHLRLGQKTAALVSAIGWVRRLYTRESAVHPCGCWDLTTIADPSRFRLVPNSAAPVWAEFLEACARLPPAALTITPQPYFRCLTWGDGRFPSDAPIPMQLATPVVPSHLTGGLRSRALNLQGVLQPARLALMPAKGPRHPGSQECFVGKSKPEPLPPVGVVPGKYDEYTT